MSESVLERAALANFPSIRPSLGRRTGRVPKPRGVPSDKPIAIVPPQPGIFLPQDHYLHRDAPAEWWWHTGTLVTTTGRTFGFEINAASFEDKLYGFTQISLTDVEYKRHYQATTPYVPLMFDGSLWAEFDVTRDWYVKLGTPRSCLSAIVVTAPGSGYTSSPTVEITGGGRGFGAEAHAFLGSGTAAGTVAVVALWSPGAEYTETPTITLTGGGGTGAQAKAVKTFVTMNAPWPDPSQNMQVVALLNDAKTGTEVLFNLSMSQFGAAFPVWGTGVAPMPDTEGTHLQTNLYYYSLTNLHTTGAIAIGAELHQVKGITWMDHEYGAFGKGGTTAIPTWILQDMQLSNGYSISNSASIDYVPHKGKRIDSHATVMDDEGNVQYVPSYIVMMDGWTNEETGLEYFLTIKVTIEQLNAELTVSTSVRDQLFRFPGDDIYEGVATVSGTFMGIPGITGTAWNEQALPPPKS